MEGEKISYLKHVALVDAMPAGGLEFSITNSKSDGDNLRSRGISMGQCTSPVR
jgi:hypothetical protein